MIIMMLNDTDCAFFPCSHNRGCGAAPQHEDKLLWYVQAFPCVLGSVAVQALCVVLRSPPSIIRCRKYLHELIGCEATLLKAFRMQTLPCIMLMQALKLIILV